jgi:hypothetical protein
MSTALASLEVRKTRPNQAPAGVGAILAYNEMITHVLPQIVAELEKKIAELEEKIDSFESKTKYISVTPTDVK